MKLYNISDKGELIKIDKLSFKENDVYLVDDEVKNTIYIWVGLEVPQIKRDIVAETARKIDKERGGSAKILIMKQKREYGSFLAMMHDLERGLIPGKTIERRPEFVLKAPPERIKFVKLDGTPEERDQTVETRILEWLQQIKMHRSDIPVEKLKEATEAVKFVKFESTPAKVEVKPMEQKRVEIKEELPEEPDFKTQIREAAYYLSKDQYTYDQLCWILAEKIQKINLDMPSIEDIRSKAEEVFNSSCTYDELCWLNAEMDILTKRSFLEQKKRKMFDY
ncbi:MAG: hypothetical protein ACFE9Q_09165 [Candidatus Hodarchaeota archaeon]